MNEDRIIQKIKKLFALAADEGAAENEAATALRMANKLLEKHSVSMIDLADEDAVSLSFMTESAQKWVGRVFLSISRLYNCKNFIDKNFEKPKYVIVGTSANRTTCTIVIKQLLDQIRKETKGKDAAFKLGAATALYWTCDEIIKERAESTVEITPGTGLVPLDLMKSAEVKNDSWIAENIGALGKAKKSKENISQAGLNYGKGLNPGARVTGKGQALLGGVS